MTAFFAFKVVAFWGLFLSAEAERRRKGHLWLHSRTAGLGLARAYQTVMLECCF